MLGQELNKQEIWKTEIPTDRKSYSKKMIEQERKK